MKAEVKTKVTEKTKMAEKKKVTVKDKVTVIAIWSICLLCLTGLFGVNSVLADEGIVFHVENQMGRAGDIVTVPIELHSGEQVGGFDIKVYYDPESMEFQELQKGGLIQDDGLFDYNHKAEEASVKIVYVVSDTVEADGTIVNLVFKLKRNCESLPIGVNLKEVIDGSEEGNAVAGKVTGTDSVYQEQAEQRATEEERAEVQDGNEEKDSQEEESGEGERAEGESGEKLSQERDSEEEGLTEKEKKDSEGKEKKEDYSSNWIKGGICIAVIGMIGAVVIVNRRRKTGKSN